MRRSAKTFSLFWKLMAAMIFSSFLASVIKHGGLPLFSISNAGSFLLPALLVPACGFYGARASSPYCLWCFMCQSSYMVFLQCLLMSLHHLCCYNSLPNAFARGMAALNLCCNFQGSTCLPRAAATPCKAGLHRTWHSIPRSTRSSRPLERRVRRRCQRAPLPWTGEENRGRVQRPPPSPSTSTLSRPSPPVGRSGFSLIGAPRDGV